MKQLPPLWLTVDTDDFFHHPKFQGHPTRSKQQTKQTTISNEMKLSIEQFEKWHQNNLTTPLTIFVIGEQLKCNDFKKLLGDLLLKSKEKGGEITIGCHGYTHTCWSAFGPNNDDFRADLVLAKNIIKDFAGEFWRPWFRAPGGYVAPWMASTLKEEGFILDSSINPTKFLSMKSGKSEIKLRYNGWDSVYQAMNNVGITERPWLTTFYPSLPACGPALHIPILKNIASATWKKFSKGRFANEKEIQNPNIKITTVYWHLLDHSKKKGCWVPPLIQK